MRVGVINARPSDSSGAYGAWSCQETPLRATIRRTSENALE
jgi:hypothetical protein